MHKGGRTRKNTTNGDILSSLLTIRNQIKVYHWQTKSFARHKGSDDLVTKLDEGIDEFIETYMGKYGRPKVTKSVVLHNFSESAARNFVAQQRAYLSNVLPRKISPHDTDLLNIRDTILGNLNQTLYLFSLV